MYTLTVRRFLSCFVIINVFIDTPGTINRPVVSVPAMTWVCYLLFHYYNERSLNDVFNIKTLRSTIFSASIHGHHKIKKVTSANDNF